MPVLTYADVGALWGIDNQLVQMLRNHQRLRVVGFEPDEVECHKLRQAFPNDIYLQYGVGDEDGSRSFFVTAFNACSSFLEPDVDAFHGLPNGELSRVVRVANVPMRRFDTLVKDGTIPQPDFVKIDSQGFELHILRGFGETLEAVLGFRMEVHFRPLYKGQALFHEIYSYMSTRGFILRDVRITRPVSYEVIEAEAFFSRDPKSVGNRLQQLKLWELLHDIPPGLTVATGTGKVEWVTLHV